MYDKPVYRLNELSMDANDYVGKKCANLGEMQNMGMPVPEGFALSIKAYEIFLENTGAKQDVMKCVEHIIGESQPEMAQVEEASREIYDIMVGRDMPEGLRNTIVDLYEGLCQETGMTDVSVAVRSSGSVSMPGQMETYLNVKGKEDLIYNVKKVWASAYTPRAIYWRLKHEELSLTDASIGVAVLRMITPRSAGVGFTVNPSTGDQSQVLIEGNWGVGESIVQGLVTPDTFMVNKADLSIGSVSVGNKLKYYDLLDSGIELREVPEEKRNAPCLRDEEAVELTRMAIKLEEHFECPQDFEWVIDRQSELPYLVQSRPAKNIQVGKSTTDKILDLMMARM